MFVIAENIQIRATRVQQAIEERDGAFFQNLARRMVGAGAHMIDLNIGPRKKDGPEVMTWLAGTIASAVDVPLSFDTTNLNAIEAGLKTVPGRKHILNPGSIAGNPERTERVFSLAARYGAGVIALTLMQTGMPANADARVEIAMEHLIAGAQQYGLPVEDLYIDPVILTVKGMQEHPKEIIEAVRACKFLTEPAPKTTGGLSNVSNGVPLENRSLINRTFLTMLLGAGLDSAICDPLDRELMEWVRIVEQRDDSAPVGGVLIRLYDAVQSMGEFGLADVDMSDPAQAEIYKTVRILRNEVIFADDYLRF